jgi:hypothetical protein
MISITGLTVIVEVTVFGIGLLAGFGIADIFGDGIKGKDDGEGDEGKDDTGDEIGLNDGIVTLSVDILLYKILFYIIFIFILLLFN